MKLWRWIPGRQKNCEYKKLCLWYFRIWKWGFDAYILKYNARTFLPIHTDVVKNGRHYRLNIKLWGQAQFFISEKPLSSKYNSTYKRINFFQPDLYYHALNIYKPTVKLSFGFVKYIKSRKELQKQNEPTTNNLSLS